jgi:UDP-GlcNAc:undecaprenyl-phosphate GlcNAc-1-phosphate transferase
LYLYRFEDYSRGVFIIYAVLFGILLAGSRLSFRVLGETASRARHYARSAIIYGAGDAGALVVRELMNNAEYDIRAVGFIDDDPSRKHRRIVGVRVLGTCEDAPALFTQLRPEFLVLSTRKLDPKRCEFVCAEARRAGVEILQLDLRLRPRDAAVGPAVSAR